VTDAVDAITNGVGHAIGALPVLAHAALAAIVSDLR
jgi:hypothetical protein